MLSSCAAVKHRERAYRASCTSESGTFPGPSVASRDSFPGQLQIREVQWLNSYHPTCKRKRRKGRHQNSAPASVLLYGAWGWSHSCRWLWQRVDPGLRFQFLSRLRSEILAGRENEQILLAGRQLQRKSLKIVHGWTAEYPSSSGPQVLIMENRL